MTDILRSEWTKLRSVRSTMWTLGVTGALMLLIGTLISLAIANSQGRLAPGLAFDSTGLSLAGMPFAALAMATLGVLVISSEYRTGAIRTSLLAVPKRLRLLSAKIVVFTVVSLVVTAVMSFASFFAGQAMLAGKGLDSALGEPDVLRAVIGCALYLTASGLFGLALGALVRHTPGAIVGVIGLILVLPQLTAMLPGEWGSIVREFFTSNAGMLITVVGAPDGRLGPWSGFAVYLGWIAATMIVAAVLMRRRDA